MLLLTSEVDRLSCLSDRYIIRNYIISLLIEHMFGSLGSLLNERLFVCVFLNKFLKSKQMLHLLPCPAICHVLLPNSWTLPHLTESLPTRVSAWTLPPVWWTFSISMQVLFNWKSDKFCVSNIRMEFCFICKGSLCPICMNWRIKNFFLMVLILGLNSIIYFTFQFIRYCGR